MNSTTKKILVAIIILAVAGFIFYPKLISDDTEEAAATAAMQGPEKVTVTAVVASENVLDNELRATGSLVANEQVTLKSEVSAVVEKIFFEEGQKVRKGQLLIQLNDDGIRAEIDKLQFTKKLNEDIERRQKKLLAKEAISKEEYETVLTTLNTTLADIKVKQVQLEKHQIRAPFDGIIGLRSVSVGRYLSPADNIATLYNVNPIKIDFSVPGKYSSEVNNGDKIRFTTDAWPDVFTGEIYAIEPRIDPKTRSLMIRAVSANKDNKLLPGQFAKIQLTLDTYESAIMIPTEAVIPELDGKKVFIQENGVAQSRQVETGIRTADNIQVISGLSAGDTVITSGILQIRAGTAVKTEIQDNE